MINFNKSFITILMGLSALIISSIELENNENCITSRNESGICSYLENCKVLLEVITNFNVSEDDREYLRKSQCGYDGNEQAITRQVKVCCPNAPDAYLKKTKLEQGLSAGDKLPEPNVCGPDFSNRIYGGNVTQIDEYPWMALIQYRKSKLYFGFHCGGVLINSRYVLTAAHCIESPDLPSTWEVHAVRLGEWDLETLSDCDTDIRGKKDCAEPHRDILVEKAIIHENYLSTSSEQYFDIALLRLSQSAEPYTDFVRPICLPIDDILRKKLYAGIDLSISGWGTTEIAASSTKKLKAIIPAWETSLCAEKFLTYKLHINNSHQICAGGLRGIDACRGDSGGPLMAKEQVDTRSIYFAVGIVSYGPRPCGLNGWPGVYTRIGYFMDWIISKLEP